MPSPVGSWFFLTCYFCRRKETHAPSRSSPAACSGSTRRRQPLSEHRKSSTSSRTTCGVDPRRNSCPHGRRARARRWARWRRRRRPVPAPAVGRRRGRAAAADTPPRRGGGLVWGSGARRRRRRPWWTVRGAGAAVLCGLDLGVRGRRQRAEGRERW